MAHEQPEPVTLSWEKINVFVRGKKKTIDTTVAEFDAEKSSATSLKTTNSNHQVLSDVTGVVKPGTLLAIQGASGAGKSTLLNVLSNRNLKGYSVEGEVKVNGVAVGKGIRNISAYVQQNDMFFSTLTVRETLTFRALLRMDNSIKREARMQRVEQVILEMGLTKCANTQIGTTGAKKSISGGELKRLSFACELLMNPALLFCDEPTSGLDYFMAERVVQTLQDIASSQNRTVLCSIHQPSSDIFALFHRVLLLAEGRVAFMGTSSQAMDFFSSLNHACPSNFNPSDFFIRTLAIAPGKEKECRANVHAICDSFRSTSNATEMEHVIKEVSSHSEENAALIQEAFSSETRYEASWGQQFRTLLWRGFVSVFRNVYLFRVRLIQTVFFAVLLGLIYLRQDYDQRGVMNINGALFLLLLNNSFSSALAVVNTFPAELWIFLREYGSRLYRTDVYFITKILAELPTFILVPLLYISIVYWMMGLNDGWQNFLIAVGIIILICNISVSFGLLISTLTADVNIALALTIPCMIPMVLFGGFFLNADTVPVYFVWLEHVSWFKYAMEILCVNQWNTIDSIDCNTNSTCQYTTGQDVLRYYGFSKDNDWLNLGVLFALMIAIRILAYIFLLIRARRSKT